MGAGAGAAAPRERKAQTGPLPPRPAPSSTPRFARPRGGGFAPLPFSPPGPWRSFEGSRPAPPALSPGRSCFSPHLRHLRLPPQPAWGRVWPLCASALPGYSPLRLLCAPPSPPFRTAASGEPQAGADLGGCGRLRREVAFLAVEMSDGPVFLRRVLKAYEIRPQARSECCAAAVVHCFRARFGCPCFSRLVA